MLTRPRSLMAACLCAVTLSATLDTPASAQSSSAIHNVYKVQAETFTLAQVATVRVDSTARGALSAEMGRSGAIWRWVITPAAQRLIVRVRATACDGPPVARVIIDGAIVAEFAVDRADWVEVPFDVEVGAGVHTVGVALTNGSRPDAGCRRVLDVDQIVLRATTPTNSATPGSTCEATDNGARAGNPPRDRFVNFLPGAPGYHELAGPTGAHAGQPPLGVVLIVHGGAWRTVGAAATAAERPTADAWRARGWLTLSISSRGCSNWVDDALWFHDAIRSLVPDLPLCMAGSSSGGHVALIVAAERPSVGCVVAEASPTDLPALAEASAYDHATGGLQSTGPFFVHHAAVAAFGLTAATTSMNPIARVDDVQADVILVAAVHDPLIPIEQASSLAAALDVAHPEASHQTVELGDGALPFVHSAVDAIDLALVETTIDIVTGLLGRR
ncbi:carbohydrate-binding domain-containing protein [Actinospongicola halichondriae]|uniref:carbohydrate-binding domain-containing protein n=1 Tax=Actinospongicola halichondriae TaxID=3236844 RepID=UPI003D46055F